jgi:hypothetical protein
MISKANFILAEGAISEGSYENVDYVFMPSIF